MKKNLTSTIIIVVIMSALSFYGGTAYQKSKTSSQMPGGNAGQFSQNRQGSGPTGSTDSSGSTQRLQNNLPVSGEITSIDDTSMTIKLSSGGTKIIILSENTKVNKTAEAGKTDLGTGTQVTIMGTTNTDGSVTAETVSIGNLGMGAGMPGNGNSPMNEPASESN